jgi:predicted enzyme related to lactoylglutathione lyase
VTLEISWLSVFADVPATRFAAACRFWAAISATKAGAPAGDDAEFTPLLPSDGDAFLWLQRVNPDHDGWHPDLHVPDVLAAARRAVSRGARVVREAPDLVVLETPAGQPFCLVADDRRSPRRRAPAPEWTAGRSLADQLCLDIPATRYDAETRFWADLTGWPYCSTDAPEFSRLNPPARLPVQFLLQRLGDDPAVARAHLDMSADDRDAEVSRHQRSGATLVRICEGWTTLRDPAGLVYCVTRRRPGEPPR